MYIKFWLLFFTYFLFLNLDAQDLRISYLGGQIRKHSPTLKYQTPTYSSGIEVSYLIHTTDQKRWQTYWKKPTIDLSAVCIDFGDNQVLGSAYGIIPNIQFYPIRGNRFKLALSFGAGGAYLSRKFDFNTNPLNNAIGSHLNNITRFRLLFIYDRFSIGGNLYHFSNGSSYTPNSGINVLLANISYRFNSIKAQPNKTIEYQRKIFKNNTNREREYKRWGLDIMYVNGFNQAAVPGGPSYDIRSFSLGLYKSLGPFMRLHYGLEYEYNETLYNFFVNDFSTEQEARDLAYNSVLYVGCEFFFGNIGFKPKLGYYLPYPIPESGDPFYIKLETHYYPFGHDRRPSPYIGMALKSHFAVAQYASIQGGVNF